MPASEHRPRVKPHPPERLRERRDALLGDLESLLNARWRGLARRHFARGAIPPHAIEFSNRITSSWALIYYRRRLVRLSPYLFLLDEKDLHHGSYWRELDATIRHEIVHAHLFHVARETGHPPEFKPHLQRLGVDPNGECDRGPTNVAYRHVYACQRCGVEWRRRARLRENWSCGTCAPGRFDPDALMLHVRRLASPYERLAEHTARIALTIEEGMRELTEDGFLHAWAPMGGPAGPAPASEGAGA